MWRYKMNINENPWQQLGKILEQNLENVNPNEIYNATDALEKANEIDPKILKLWEEKFGNLRAKVPEENTHQPAVLMAAENLHATLADLTFKIKKSSDFNIYKATKDTLNQVLNDETIKGLRADSKNRFAIYDEDEHTFYVYKSDPQKQALVAKKIRRSEAIELKNDNDRTYIGREDSNKA
jgi:hypothetical protein